MSVEGVIFLSDSISDCELILIRGLPSYSGKAGNSLKEKVGSLRTVISHAKNILPALFQRVNLYGHLKNYHNAIIDYDRIVEMAPDFGPAYLNRGVLQSQLIVMFNAFNNSQNNDFKLVAFIRT